MEYTTPFQNLNLVTPEQSAALLTWTEVAQSCPTLCDPLDWSPPGSSVLGIFQAKILEWVPFPSPEDLPDPAVEPGSPALQADALPSEPPLRTQNLANRPSNEMCWKNRWRSLGKGLAHSRRSSMAALTTVERKPTPPPPGARPMPRPPWEGLGAGEAALAVGSVLTQPCLLALAQPSLGSIRGWIP